MERVLVLRRCGENMQSYKGFQWPDSGHVSAPDWDPFPRCGHGLHGLLRGEGDYGLLKWDRASRWVVCSVDPERIVDLDGKVKFPECEVVHVGDQGSATSYIHTHLGYPANYNPVICGTAAAGNYGRATAGDGGYAKAGRSGFATVGHEGRATVDDFGHAFAGNYGNAVAGDYGYAFAGNYGNASAGDYGYAQALEYGRATAGRKGRADSGLGGTVMAGEGGRISLEYWDEVRDRNAILVGYIGQDGLEPYVPYECVVGKFVSV